MENNGSRLLDNDETKNFLVELFDLQERRLEAKFDAKFAEQEKRLEDKFDKKFAEQEKRLEDKFDAKFAEQNEYIDKRFAEQNEYIDKRFAEQNALFEAKFDELRFEVNQVVGEILDVVTNKFKRERKKTNEKIKKEIALL